MVTVESNLHFLKAHLIVYNFHFGHLHVLQLVLAAVAHVCWEPNCLRFAKKHCSFSSFNAAPNLGKMHFFLKMLFTSGEKDDTIFLRLV